MAPTTLLLPWTASMPYRIGIPRRVPSAACWYAATNRYHASGLFSGGAPSPPLSTDPRRNRATPARVDRATLELGHLADLLVLGHPRQERGRADARSEGRIPIIGAGRERSQGCRGRHGGRRAGRRAGRTAGCRDEAERADDGGQPAGVPGRPESTRRDHHRQGGGVGHPGSISRDRKPQPEPGGLSGCPRTGPRAQTGIHTYRSATFPAGSAPAGPATAALTEPLVRANVGPCAASSPFR